METNEEKTKRWFYYGFNRDETIEHLTQKLGEAGERVSKLERELEEAREKLKAIPTFVKTGSLYRG